MYFQTKRILKCNKNFEMQPLSHFQTVIMELSKNNYSLLAVVLY